MLDFPTTVSISSGSQQGPQTAGPIAITMKTTPGAVWPLGVEFSVDLSNAMFATQPGPANGYDPQKHKLIYVWDTGDTGNYDAPVNVEPIWRDKSYGYGPIIKHVYTGEGPFTARVVVFEPSTGWSSSASIVVDPSNPDIVYAGDKTFCISTAGNFGGAPAGFRPFTDFDTGLAAYLAASVPSRLLFARDEIHPLSNSIVLDSSVSQEVYFGSFGSGNKPKLTTDVQGRNCFNLQGSYADAVAKAVRIMDIEFEGSWDETTGTGNTQNFVNRNAATHLVLANTVANKVNAVVSGTESRAATSSILISNHATQGTKNYALFSAAAEFDVRWGIIGSKIISDPDAVAGWGPQSVGGSGGGTVRINHAAETYAAGNDFTIAHGQGTYDQFFQSCFKWNEQIVDGVTGGGEILVMHSNSLEGGAYQFKVNGAQGANAAIAHNAIIAHNIFCGDYTTSRMMLIRGCGFSIYGNKLYNVGTERRSGAMQNFIDLELGNPVISANTTDQPVDVFGNAFVNLTTSAQNNNVEAGIIETTGYTAVTNENNLHFQPEYGTDDNPEPLDETLHWTPRNKGRKPGDTLVVIPGHETPADTLKTLVPLTGSNVIGAATSGLTLFTDFNRMTVDDVLAGLSRNVKSRGPVEPVLES